VIILINLINSKLLNNLNLKDNQMLKVVKFTFIKWTGNNGWSSDNKVTRIQCTIL